ncbi:unnamed protein product, partial [Ectocarpus fasciculatus]
MTTTKGSSKCLDAFTLALSQACDGQEERWYVSTLELQLVSLELCQACRSAQLLDARVDEDTPPTLWTSRASHTTPGKRSETSFIISNRVPAVQAFGWTWKLPVDHLPQRASMELHPGPKCPQQNGQRFDAGVGSVVLPRSLKRLEISMDMSINAVSWPASLQQLSFGYYFNQSIVGAPWPASLHHLSFGDSFNQPIVGAPWPASLQQLSFGDSFNQPIFGVTWPAS